MIKNKAYRDPDYHENKVYRDPDYHEKLLFLRQSQVWSVVTPWPNILPH